MPTLGPTISSTGIIIPDFADILAQLQSQYTAIYGTDAIFTPDTQDGQFLSIFAQAVSDCDVAAVALYNSFSINNAQGAALSSLVKLVGVRRAVAGFSTDTLTVTGAPGQILNGQVGDNLGQGSIWNLPAVVNIPLSGTVNVTITNTQAGNTIFSPGQITNILTPQLGWTAATNIGPATAGAPVQQDAPLRQIATSSVGGPASTVLNAIFAAIANTANVTRFALYENDTDVNDANGQGPHSIYAVVQGGSIQGVVNAIGSTKSPGTTTLGTTSGTYIDPSGVPDVINYYQLTIVQITVTITLVELPGFVTNTKTLIQQAVSQFINTLTIGEKSYLNRLWSPANLSGDAATIATGLTQAQLDAISATYNVSAILQSRPSDAPPAAQDVPIAFNEAATSIIANITVTP